MKKNILFIFLFLMFPLSVYADHLELKCNNDNNQIICEIEGNSNSAITEVNFKVTKTENITISSINISDEWKVISKTDNNYVITRNTSTNDFKIGNIVINNLNTGSGYLGIESIKYKDIDNREIKVNDVKKNIPLLDKDSLVKNILIENYLINFNPEVFEYELKINDEDSLNIIVIPEYEDTKYVIINNHELTNGKEIEIVTNSAKETSTTYKIKISKEMPQNYEKYKYIYFGVIGLIFIINISNLISRIKNK